MSIFAEFCIALEKALQARIAVPLHVSFSPLYGDGKDGEMWGDVTTNIVQQVAALSSISADVVWNDISKELQGYAQHFEIRFRKGHLNIKFLRPGIDDADVSLFPKHSESSPYVVLVTPPSSTVSYAGYSRLVSAAIVQWGWLEYCGIPAQLQFYRPHESLLTSLAPNAPVKPFESGEEASLVERIVNTAPAICSVWMTSDLFSKQRFRVVADQLGLFSQRPDRIQFRRRIELSIPDAPWYQGNEIPPKLIAQYAEKSLLGTALLLSGETMCNELDLHAVGTGERENLRWYLESTQERSTKIVPDFSETAPQLDSVGIADRESWHCFRFIQEHAAWCAMRGDSIALISGCYRFLDRWNRLLNDPGLRQRLSVGQLSSSERYLLAGGKKALSGMISGVRSLEESVRTF